MMKLHARAILALLAGSALSVHPAHAQDAEAAQDKGAQSGLQDIIITAERRAGSLQDTPIAITAFNADAIESRQITNINDLTAIAPNLVATNPVGSPVATGVFIRGIGGQEPLLTLDNAVAIYVDGIVLGRAAGAALDIAELERVEVLRGPQGTLYGRNAVGGAVNLITRKPSKTFGISQTATVGNYGVLKGLTTINTGDLGASGVAATFSYFHKQRNGVVDIIGQPRSKDGGAWNTDAFRVALGFENGGPLRVNYSFDYSNTKSTPQAFQLTVVDPVIANSFQNSAALGGSPLTYSRTRLDRLEIGGDQSHLDKNWAHTLAVEWDVSDAVTVKSLTGYRKWTQVRTNQNLSGNGPLRTPGGTYTLFTTDDNLRQEQWSQEFNVIGSAGRLNYILGAYYFEEKSREHNPQSFFFPAYGIQLGSLLSYSHVSKSKALFVQASYELTERLTFTGGLRNTWDKRAVDQVAPAVLVAERNFNKFNWSATLDFQASSALLLYAKASTGYKSGGFNPRSAQQNAFDPETVDAYEVGFKSDLFDRRLRVNASAFYNKQNDLQVQQLRADSGGAATIVTNAGKVDFKGVELEVTAVPVDGLTLYANGGYIDRKYKQFIVRDPVTDQLIDIKDTAKFIYSASTTMAAGAEYRFPAMSFGQLAIRLDYNYQSKRYFNVGPIGAAHFEDIVAGGRGLFDARADVSDIAIGGGRMRIGLFGKNIFDKEYRLSGIDFGSLGTAGNTYGDPMTWGIDAKIEF